MNPVHSTRIAPPLAVCLLLGGCSLFGSDEKDFYEHLTPVRSFELAQQEGLDLTFTLYSNWPNGCWLFSRFEVEQAEHTYDVGLYGGYPPVGVCTTIYLSIEEEWSVTVSEPGTYTFRFSRGEQAPLDTTITVQ